MRSSCARRSSVSRSPRVSTVSRSRASPSAHSQYFHGTGTANETSHGRVNPPTWSSGHAVISRPVRSESRAAKTRTSTKAAANAFARASKWPGAAAAITASRNIETMTVRTRVSSPATSAYITTLTQANQTAP